MTTRRGARSLEAQRGGARASPARNETRFVVRNPGSAGAVARQATQRDADPRSTVASLRKGLPVTDRVSVTDRSGVNNRRPHAREHPMQWVTHETWLPGTREIAFVDWPRGMGAVHADTGAVRRITDFPAWHAVSDATGARIVCDTTRPDRGLHLIGGDGPALFLCASEALNRGAHGGGPFPYNDGPVAVEAAQHTHPHPRFAPDGSRIVFTSDRSGHAQIHEVMP